MSTSKPADVPSLGTQSFYTIVKHLWKTSGVVSKLIDYVQSMVTETRPVGAVSRPTIEQYYERIDQIATELLTWDFLPRPTILKLGNCFLDHDKNMRAFITSLVLSVVDPSRENIEICVNNIVITPAGHIDKRKTIIELAVYPEKEIFFTKRFTAHYCVALLDVVQRILNDPIELDRLDADPTAVRLFPKSFSDPAAFWESKSHIMGMRDQYLQFLAIHGSNESVEYFLRKIPVKYRQKELAQAAMWSITVNVPAIEKFLFFYHHLNESAWLEFLRRNFFTIFTVFLTSKRYRHMCTVFYHQVLDTIQTKTVNCILAYISVQSTSESSSSVHHKLFYGEVDVIMINIWRMTPRKHKEAFGINFFRNLIFFSNRGFYNMIVAILEDPIFDEHVRSEMLGCVVMNYIIFDRFQEISILFKKLKLDCSRPTISKYITASNMRVFMIYGDNCRHIDLYTKLFAYKFVHPSDLHSEKVNLIENKDFLDKLLKGIIAGVMSFEDLQTLLWWGFSKMPYLIRRFYINFLLPNEIMNSNLKYQMISSNSNFQLKRLFQTEFELLKLSISQDKEYLYQHCADFIKDLDIKSLQRMFRCIFKNYDEVEEFMNSFYESDVGTAAVYNMIVENTYDVNYYSTFDLKTKLKRILRFREDFVLNDDMAIRLDAVLRRVGHPNSASFEVQLSKLRSSVKLLPHESLADRRVIVDANYRIFRATICSHDVVEIITSSILSRYNLPPLSLTELSIEYEIEAGIIVPVVL